MPKIYLSPAYHKTNNCIIDGCFETTHNNLYLDELEPYLKACRIDFKRGPRRTPMSDEDGSVYTRQAVKESNEWGADIHYVSHTNGFDGTISGYRPMVYSKDDKNMKLANIMFKWRMKIYKGFEGGSSSIYVRPDLYELNSTKAIGFYEEHVFHDNKQDAEWFHKNLRLIAEYTCRGFCEYFNIPFVDPYEKKEEPTEIYRVRKSWDDVASQLGAWKNLEAAKKQANDNSGYKVFDSAGKCVYESKVDESFKVEIKISNLNIRKGPGTNYATTGKYTGKGVFTIVETKSGTGSKAGWGKLKSGAGWISLDYATKI